MSGSSRLQLIISSRLIDFWVNGTGCGFEFATNIGNRIGHAVGEREDRGTYTRNDDPGQNRVLERRYGPLATEEAATLPQEWNQHLLVSYQVTEFMVIGYPPSSEGDPETDRSEIRSLPDFIALLLGIKRARLCIWE